MSATLVRELVAAAATGVQLIINHAGDGPTHCGALQWTGASGELTCLVRNANNHQMTRAVLLAALPALADFMSNDGWALVAFNMIDGQSRLVRGFFWHSGHSRSTEMTCSGCWNPKAWLLAGVRMRLSGRFGGYSIVPFPTSLAPSKIQKVTATKALLLI